jgi:hypothetical protein
LRNAHATGTSSIVHETTHQPLLSTLSAIVETVVRLRAAGHKVVLVSSGAIGVGLQRMAMPARPKSFSGKKASRNKRSIFSVDPSRMRWKCRLIALKDN